MTVGDAIFNASLDMVWLCGLQGNAQALAQ